MVIVSAAAEWADKEAKQVGAASAMMAFSIFSVRPSVCQRQSVYVICLQCNYAAG